MDGSLQFMVVYFEIFKAKNSGGDNKNTYKCHVSFTEIPQLEAKVREKL